MPLRRAAWASGAVVVLAVAWLVATTLLARAQLLRAEARIATIRGGFAGPVDVDTARELRAAQHEARRARTLTVGPVWWAAERLPLVGRDARGIRRITATAEALARTTVPDVLAAKDELLDASGSGNRFDLTVFARVERRLARVERQVAVAHSAITGRAAPLLPAVGSAYRDVGRELAALRRQVRTLADATRVAPAMLGVAGPRRYFVAFQNNAELRATGGLIGSYAIVRADHGVVSLEKVASNAELRSPDRPIIDLGPEYDARYRGFAGDYLWSAVNLTPHYPAVNRIITALYAHQGGGRVDGSVSTDPVALSYLLGVTGPAQLRSGEVVSADNVVALTLRDAYARFAADDSARKQFLTEVARAAFAKVLSPALDRRRLLGALVLAVAEGRLLAASNHPAEQAVLEVTTVGGALDRAGGPFLHVVTQNAGGNKLDYYLHREIRYHAYARRDQQRVVDVEVRLTNGVPAETLPPVVTGRLDAPRGPILPGQSRLYLSVYASRGAELLNAVVDGTAIATESAVEQTHPVFSAYVEVKPRSTTTIVLRFRDPASAGGGWRPTVRPQPLVVNDRVEVRVDN
ncbi:MAG: DUF4012 domain-containing protein [Frankia sp.]|nr:DUF4012 domain-containing protein [Frankia sp.]MCA1833584.1 DUF4012 domain-containing protein [Actinomycetota bacterium]